MLDSDVCRFVNLLEVVQMRNETHPGERTRDWGDTVAILVM